MNPLLRSTSHLSDSQAVTAAIESLTINEDSTLLEIREIAARVLTACDNPSTSAPFPKELTQLIAEYAVEPLIEIRQISDVAPFANSIVACKASTYPLTFGKCYQVGASSLTFAFITHSFSPACQITPLKKSSDVPCTAQLNTHTIKKQNPVLKLRFAKREELHTIREAIDAQQAEFGYMFMHKKSIDEALQKWDSRSKL